MTSPAGEERRVPFKVGDDVLVPYIKGHISALKSSGIITFILPPYAIVNIIYGRQTGKWTGKITELDRRNRGKPRRRESDHG